MSAITLDLVIARYNEDLNWLTHTISELEAANINVNAFVYNKGPSHTSVPSHKNLTITSLPNVGRESHTYLHHIIENYDRYAAAQKDHYVIFLQGGFADHMFQWYIGHETPTQLIKAFIANAREYGASIKWAKKHEYVGANAAHAGFRIAQHNGRFLYPRTDTSFGEWFTRNVDPTPFTTQTHIYWWISALFAIRANQLAKAHPKTYYEELIAQLQHLDPEVGHFFERSWVYITGAHHYLSQ